MTPGAYNNNVQIVQAPGYVVIINEMVHNARIIPTDGRPHTTLRQWSGDSRGRWEGDTLVVETINFRRETSLQGSTADTRLVERFTRIDADTIRYEFTVSDPNSYTRPWSAMVPLVENRTGPIFRVRLPRGQLRPAEHSRRRARSGKEGRSRQVSHGSAGMALMPKKNILPLCIGVAAAVMTTVALAAPRALPAGRVARLSATPIFGRGLPDGTREWRTGRSGAAQARKTLDTYCVGCHNSRVRAGGVAFDTLSLRRDAASTPTSGKPPCASCAAG